MLLRPDEFLDACLEQAGIAVIAEMDILIRRKDGSAKSVPFNLAGYDGVINPGSAGDVDIIEAILVMETRSINARVTFFGGRRDYTWSVEPNEIEAVKLKLYL